MHTYSKNFLVINYLMTAFSTNKKVVCTKLYAYIVMSRTNDWSYNPVKVETFQEQRIIYLKWI